MRALVDHVFLKYSLCHVLLSDQGLEFENEILLSLSAILGVTKIRASSYRPQSNAICEVLHRVLNTMFAKCISENQKDWVGWLLYLTFCYNAAEHTSTKFPPFFLFMGRMPVWSIDLVLPKVQCDETVPEYAAGVAEKLEEVQNVVRHNLNDAWSTSCKWYNRKVKTKSFEIGQTLLVYYSQKYRGKTPKWQSYYSTVGTVVQKFNDATYLVKSKT